MKNKTKISTIGDITLERRAKILEILEEEGQVKVKELSKLFDFSEVTIRNDLDKLEEKGLLIRSRGGGLKNQRVKFDYQLQRESIHYSKEKQAIGKKASELVKENDTIILDSGTTTLEVARNLINLNNLTIITNALNIASELVNYPNLKVVMLGGSIRQSTLSLIGPIAEDNMKSLYCDKVFIGVNGIDSKHGIFTTNIEDAYLNRLMLDNSKEVIVVTDSSKFLKRSFAAIAPIAVIDILITDKNIPEDEFRNLENSGIKVIIVNS